MKTIKQTESARTSYKDNDGSCIKKRMSLLKTGVMLSLAALSLQPTLKAQDRVTPTWWFGISGAANFNFYRGTVQTLNDNLTLPSAFDHGFGVAPYASIFAEWRPGPVWGLMLNFAYDGRQGIFTQAAPGQNGTSLTARYNYLAFEPSLRIAPWAGKLYFFIGPRLSYNVDHEFLYQPVSGPNNEARFSDVYGIRVSAQVGMGYEIPISAPANTTQWALAPFVSFLPYFGEQPRQSESLTLTTVRAGLALKFGCGPKKLANEVIVTPAPAPAPEPVINFSVVAPTTVPAQRKVKELLPLSNYVFFDEGSTQIPNRYVILTKDQAQSFREEQLQDCQRVQSTRASRQLTMYHNVLNIVAARMMKYPNSTITLIGASGGKGEKLGKENAESVKDYLVNVFGIDGSRIAVEGRSRPIVPSEQPTYVKDTNFTRVEDNRVDIVSNSKDLMMEIKDNSALCMRPIEVTAMDGSSPSDAQVYVTADGATAGVQTWSVTVTDSLGNVQNFGPFTSDKATVSGAAIIKDGNGGNYKMTMVGTTPSGEVITKYASFNLKRQYQPEIPDQRVSILFEFDKSRTMATFDKFLREKVTPLIAPNSTVTISGYTDIVGYADHNLQLSEDRAREAQTILSDATNKAGITGVTFNAKGYGETGTEFSNTLPEERFYNRTVVIDISSVPSTEVTTN